MHSLASRASVVTAVALAFSLAGPVASAAGQTVAERTGTERIDSDRPEAWALRYFTANTLVAPFAVPVRLEPGAVLIAGEAGWIPRLTDDQRRVGFNGTKLEDLNKAPAFVRPRITVGLPRGLAATVAFVPPVEMFGIRPNLVAASLEGVVYETPAWNLGWRTYGQTGTARAAFVCSASDASFAAGTPQNRYGCLEPSTDTATLRYAGVEAVMGQSLAHHAVAPHVALALTYFDNRIEVNSRRYDTFNGVRQEFVDRTAQTSHSTNISLTAGLGFALSPRVHTAVDVFYTPIWVRRPASGSTRNDGLLTAKALLTYRAR